MRIKDVTPGPRFNYFQHSARNFIGGAAGNFDHLVGNFFIQFLHKVQKLRNLNKESSFSTHFEVMKNFVNKFREQVS